MRIAFVWDWPPVISQVTTWEDGLAAALKELQKRGHELQVFMPGTDNVIKHPYFDIAVHADVAGAVHAYKPDVILAWGDMTRPNAKPLRELGIPIAICFAGGDVLGENCLLFDHIFVESDVYKAKLLNADIEDVSIAFGTNTDLFTPVEQTKVFDTIFPATFALWKRHNLYAAATNGLRSLAVGYMYNNHEQECWQECLRNGVTILPHTSAQVLKYLYAASRVCVIPSRSDGGSQRTVLEAMAMNLPLIITDSDKYDYAYGRVFECEPNVDLLRNTIYSALNQEVNTRQYVLDNWSHIQYADELERGLTALL